MRGGVSSKLWLWPLGAMLAASCAVLGAGWYSFGVQRGVVRERALEGLTSLAFHKALLIRQWYRQCSSDAADVLNAPSLSATMAGGGTGLKEADKGLLREGLDKYALEHGFEGAALLDESGSQLAWSRTGAALPCDYGSRSDSGAESRGVTVSSLHADEQGRWHLEARVPVSGAPLGTGGVLAVVFRINAWRGLFPSFALPASPDNDPAFTACLFQPRAEGVEVFRLPGSPGETFEAGSLAPGASLAASLAMSGEMVRGEGPDPDGAPSLYATNWVPQAGLGVAVFMDRGKAFASLRPSNILLTGTALLALTAVAAFIFGTLARRHASEMGQLAGALQVRSRELEETTVRLRHVRAAERGRVARQLHSDVLQLLDIAKAYLADSLERLPSRSNALVKGNLAKSREFIGSAESECREIVSRLTPVHLEGKTLPQALRDLALPHGRINVRYDIEEDGSLEAISPEAKEALFRVAQEALANAAKHCEAGDVDVKLERGGGRLLLEVSDAGRGFDPASPPAPGHKGLAHMREVAEEAQGALVIRSSPGGGTKISFSLPAQGQTSREPPR